MAVIKCKMCGGDLVLVENQSVAECEYCGSKQTVPAADNEKKLNLFASANKLRTACEFDRAAGVYDAIKAEFPSEAEAYWGLVLCKYGIEYVDDPATGKKVPTCHRLSFDSVMDDGNLEMAMDCADSVARKVYREEAKHLEQIRQGILRVSSNEKPYDIFICYKETDEKGDRTLDSVLAQDLYSALTEKGYRVFFSRITLQSKLGEAYEPYIFAALNSAKVMLAVGTDPDYYSAVWVKNEWSRYLKICAGDNSKHLIPCYKGLDAYDLPREFRPLQGVDLGKMGAVQDILFNMEKYIPMKKQTTTVIQEKVVVGGTGGNNKIASLLDRGNMALEDGDWAKADSFFEDVLNNDSKNAQAYIGKTLAQERCRTMDALVRKRKDVYQNVSSEKLYIGEKAAHISQMVERYSLSGYVEQTSIRNLYRFDLSYTSEVSGRQKQYHEEELWWQNHKQLSRAEKFAMGAVVEHLQNEKKHLFAQLADRVKKAREADSRSIAKLEAAYDAHIAEADNRAEKLYNDGLTRREKDYENWLEQAKKETSPDKLRKLADNFVSLRAFKDSKNLAEHCRKRAAEEQAKIDAENERQRVIAEQKKKAQQKRNKTIAMIAAVAIAGLILISKVIIPENDYKKAVALAENGRYEEARDAFMALGDYRDAEKQAHLMYERAVEKIREEQEEIAAAKKKEREAQLAAEKKAEEERLAAEKKARDEQAAKDYVVAEELVNNGETTKAAIAFGKIGDYQDARERSFALWSDIRKIETVGIGYGYTAALKRDGTVVTAGYNNSGQCDTTQWRGIVAISVGSSHTVGLKSDGTVVAAGSNKYGQCNVTGWKDIIAVSAGRFHTLGLKVDGTVVAAGDSATSKCDVSDWTDIVDIKGGLSSSIGIKSDGTVVAAGTNQHGECNVSGWSNIVSIGAGYYHTVGVRADGTVISTGKNDDGQCNVSSWKNIVAVNAGETHTIGLTADGTAVAVGENSKFKKTEVGGWRNLVAVDADLDYSLGLTSGGRVVETGVMWNDETRKTIRGWSGIKLP